MAAKPIDVSDADLQKMVREKSAVVVDFWAPWCRPCRVISPIVEELAEADDGGVAFAKLNIDDNPESPMRYDIMGVPTLLFFKEGELVDRIVGVVPRSKIESTLDKLH